RSGHDDGVGRVDLVHAQKMFGGNTHLLGHPAAVFRDIGRLVPGAQSAVETRIDSAPHASLTREEGMTQSRNGCEQRRTERHAVSSPDSGGSSLRPATMVRSGLVT